MWSRYLPTTPVPFGMDDKFFRDHNVAFLVGKQALQFVRVPRRTEALTLTTRAEHSRRVPSSASLRSRMPPGSWWPRWTGRWILVDQEQPPHHAGTELDRGKFLE